jgi:hypothetical protein
MDFLRGAHTHDFNMMKWVPRRIFTLKRQEVSGGLRKLHNEAIRNM